LLVAATTAKQLSVFNAMNALTNSCRSLATVVKPATTPLVSCDSVVVVIRERLPQVYGLQSRMIPRSDASSSEWTADTVLDDAIAVPVVVVVGAGLAAVVVVLDVVVVVDMVAKRIVFGCRFYRLSTNQHSSHIDSLPILFCCNKL
jgi:ABC-type xylose transport system permease subunit